MDILGRIYRILQANAHAGQDMSYEDIEEWLRRSGYGPAFSGSGGHSKESTSTDSVPLDPELAGYYANLEIPYGSDLETARRAWRSLMKKYHPDLHSQNLQKREVANELTAELTKAYQEIERALTTEGKV